MRPTNVQNFLKSLALAVPEILQGCEILKYVMWSWPRPLGRQLVVTRLILHAVNSCTKFEVSICKILKCVTWPWPRPFQGWLVLRSWNLLPLTYRPNLKFLTTTNNTNIRKAVQKIGEIGRILGRLGVIRGHRQCHHSIESIRLPIRL